MSPFHIRPADQRCIVAGLTFFLIAVFCGSFRKTETPAPRQYVCRINVNTATAGEWQMLPGIGPKLAESILDYRSHLAFEKSRDLMNVKGIGNRKYEAVKPYLLEPELPSL